MSRAWKFHNPNGLYFISFATVGWIDVFTRNIYREILVESFKYCQLHKGLELSAWVVMTNHVHIIARTQDGFFLQDVLRDFKKYTSKQLLKTIQENGQESRKEWMLSIFKKAGKYNSNNKGYQFWRQDNKPIELVNLDQVKKAIHYVHRNPVEAGIVDVAEHYVYGSARDYAGEKGLLKVYLL